MSKQVQKIKVMCPSHTATELGTNKILSGSKASALGHYAPFTSFNSGLNLTFFKS